MNGARIGRRGKIQGGRAGSAGQAAACPSDPFGTGLMIAGGYANGHPLAGEANGNRKGGKPAGGRGAAGGGAGGGGKPGGRAGGKAGGGGKPRGARAASANGPAAATGRWTRRRAPVASRRVASLAASRRPRVAAMPLAVASRRAAVAAATRLTVRAPVAAARAAATRVRALAASRAARNAGSSRGDDWQPRGASAHESRLGVMGGRGGRGR
ncbi:hypothetical protein WJ972_33845 [Achromobacter insuavis]